MAYATTYAQLTPAYANLRQLTPAHGFGDLMPSTRNFSILKWALSGHLITKAIFTYAKTTPHLRLTYAKNSLRFPRRVLIN